jgi:hypothetical protein
MFRNIITITTFSDDEELECLSTKELYIIHKLLYDNKHIKCNFKDFCVSNFFFLSNYDSIQLDINYSFLTFFFSSKTNQILSFRVLKDVSVGSNIIFCSNISKPHFGKLNIF